MIWAIGLVAALACGDGPETAGQAADWSVRDSAGVTIVTNHADPIARGCVTITPDPLVTIRSDTDQGGAIPPIYLVRGGVVLENGRILVLNEGSDELFFFTADGAYQYAVGGSGRGPGEFEKPTWLGLGGDDTLFVWDSGLMRLSTLDHEGNLLASHQVRAAEWEDGTGAFDGRFADGSFFVRPQMVYFGPETGIVRPPEPYRRYDVETQQVARIIVGAGGESVVGEGAIYFLPFGKTDRAAALGDAIVIGDDGTSTLRYYDLHQTLRRVVSWVSAPIPVTDRDRKEFLRYHAKTSRPAFARLYDNARFAEERPRFSTIESDEAGWLWVRSYAASWEPRGHWLLFDAEGILRCRIDLPERFRPLQIGESHILAVRRDRWGEESVVLHALARHSSVR